MARKNHDEHYWTNNIDSSTHRAWSGYAFELVTITHLDAIKAALGIAGVSTSACTWRSKVDTAKTKRGAQIDLVIDRNDQVINLCEMKYSQGPFTIDKASSENLRNKIAAFKNETKTRKAIHLTMITTYGILKNEYSGMVQSELTGEDLFKAF